MTTLKTIIQMSHDEIRRNVSPSTALSEVWKGLKPREAEVLTKRYGLGGHKSETLQEIGEKFNISRERVRQVENSALAVVRAASDHKPLKDLLALQHEILRSHGGVTAETVLLDEFLLESKRTASEEAAALFILGASRSVTEVSETRQYRRFYALSSAHARAVETLAGITQKMLQDDKKAEAASVEDLHVRLLNSPSLDSITYLFSESLLESTLQIAKAFTQADDGRWGLVTWSDINPRNIRDKTRFTLKRAGTPLHFTEITERIRAAKFDAKPVTTQAVHNELINGSEFVLIGRGIYGLSDWGYVEGTVSDVIEKLLRDAGKPLEREAIIESVLQQRHVSRNTIIINLQNKERFTQVAKHQYEPAQGAEK